MSPEETNRDRLETKPVTQEDIAHLQVLWRQVTAQRKADFRKAGKP